MKPPANFQLKKKKVNTQNDKQNEVSEAATVSYAETCEAEGATLAGFNAKQTERILGRLAKQRASASGERIHAQAWRMLETIGQEIADKLNTLRVREKIMDRI